ncbi:MAG: site-specific integrase [Aggregatilineales bacterium]
MLSDRLLAEEQRTKRKVATDAIVPYFAALRAEAHFRHNKLARLLTAYKNALGEAKNTSAPLPFSFSLDEGAERLWFRIWDYPTFILGHTNSYSRRAIFNARRIPDRFSMGPEFRILEFVKAELVNDGQPSDGYWFLDMLRLRLIGRAAMQGTKAQIEVKRAWLRKWGYLPDESARFVTPFSGNVRGLLCGAPHEHLSAFIRMQEVAEGVIIPIQSLYDAATFGLLAINLFTTTGMRINEALQTRLSDDCFFRVSMAAPPGAKERSPRLRYGFRLIPKGERRDVPQNYFIGEETKKLLVATAEMLKAHYCLQEGQPLPLVPFNRTLKRAHRFREARYLFQYNHTHLRDNSVSACMRFLMHGMAFPDKDGKNVILTPHLLRHTFATYAAHIEKLPIDVIGAMLHHKNVNVTEYYAKPTESIVANWQDPFLDRLAAHVDLGEAIIRAPEALRDQLQSSLEKVGTLYQTLGGQCTLHAICPIQFACIGCAANVPDPDKRYQVERERQRASHLMQEATIEARVGDAQRWKVQIQRCETVLKEMDQIEAYRKDAARSVTIRIEDIPCSAPVARRTGLCD